MCSFKYILLIIALFVVQAFTQNLRIYHIDVDQGDATLIVAPNGHSLLIDSGKNGHGQRLRNAMQEAGITQLDCFIDTHYHEDHYGGIDELASPPAITIGTVYDRGDKAFLPPGKDTEDRYVEYDTTFGHRAVHLTRGMSIPLDPNLSIICISSGGVVLGEPDPVHPASDENDMSISLLLNYGNFRYFIGGDIEDPSETKIADLDVVQDVDVYQADHHGADNGTTTAFLNDLHPTAIIISNGTNGTYRHPRETTLTRMNALSPQPAIFQTNKNLQANSNDAGSVPDAFIADLESVDDDGTILLTVNPVNNNYTISYRNQQHTYNIKNRNSGNIVIASLLPDPDNGADRLFEEVTLQNKSSSAIDMHGWFLIDATNKVWNLAGMGSIAAGAQATIQRNGMAMSLNNNQDTIRLVDPASQTVDSFQYTNPHRGVPINTGH